MTSTSAAERDEEVMRRSQVRERTEDLAGAVTAMSEAVELAQDSMKYRACLQRAGYCAEQPVPWGCRRNGSPLPFLRQASHGPC